MSVYPTRKISLSNAYYWINQIQWLDFSIYSHTSIVYSQINASEGTEDLTFEGTEILTHMKK